MKKRKDNPIKTISYNLKEKYKFLYVAYQEDSESEIKKVIVKNFDSGLSAGVHVNNRQDFAGVLVALELMSKEEYDKSHC